jgi:hypothetical protein
MSKNKIGVIASIVMTLSLVATSVFALTSADISMLQAAGIINATQASSLMASIAAPVATASSYTFTKSLTIGSTGADVTALQQVLVSQGDLVMPAGTAFGYFGNLTKTALAKYQAAMGISPAVGYFGPITMAKVNATAGSSVTTTGGTTVVASGTGISFALAATSPSAGSVIEGQAAADLAEYTFTNTSSAPAVVTNVTLNRGGVSADTSLANVYLFQGATRLTDAATVSSGQITFNSGTGLFTVAPGQSVTVAVKADIASSAAAGQTVNVALTGVTASIPGSGVYPITGSTFTVAVAADLAKIGLTAVQPATQVDAGTLQYTIWGASLSESGRAVYLKSAAFKVIGSVPTNSLANIGLFISGVQVATASGVDNNGMITFDLSSNPYKIDSNRSIEVRADIVNGADRTFSVDLQNAADFQIVDSNYNVGITASGIPMSENTISINSGSLSASQDATLSSGNVVVGSTNVDLAKYTLRGYGEDVKVSYLNISATQDLTNVTLYANGASISSSQNVSSTTATLFSLGSSLVIPAGGTVSLDIKGDLKNSAGTNIAAGQTVTVTLSSYPNNAQGSYSSTLSTFPLNSVTGPTMSVVGAGLTVAQNASYNSSTLTANTTNFKIGSFVLSSNSSEPVRVTGLTVNIGGSLGITGLSNLYTSVNSTKVNPQLSNNFSTNITIPANGSQTVDIFADIGNLTSATTITAATGTVTVTATGVNPATVTINGIGYTFTGTTSTSTAANIATGLAALINANSSMVTATVTASPAVLLITQETTPTLGEAVNGGITLTATAGDSITAMLGGGVSVTTTGSTASTSLAVTANGVYSNIDASRPAVVGQTFTVGVGSIVNAPTLTSASPSAQLVLGGTTNSAIATFNFKATIGAASITEMDFNTNPSGSTAITSITVADVTQNVSTGATTTLSFPVGISVPLSNAGVNIPVTVTYNNVSSNGGIPSDVPVQLKLTRVKFISGNATNTIYPSPIPQSSQLTPVAAYPVINLVQSVKQNQGSINGTNEQIAQITVTASGNSVNLTALPIALSFAGTASTTGNINLVVDGNSSVVIASSSASINGTGTTTLAFIGTGYIIPANTTVTFDVMANITGATIGAGNDSIKTQLGSASFVKWDDIEGAAVGIDATLIPSYGTAQQNYSSMVN